MNTPLTSATITSKDGRQIYYQDWGRGPVVTFSHGWPLDADAWGKSARLIQDAREATHQDQVNANLLAFLRS